jgi:phage shock protein C
MVAGICGGIAEYFNVDSTLIRIGYVLIGALTAFIPLIIAYIIGWFIIPEESDVT